MDEKKQRVSRRQFLNYTLTGVGGFMAAGMLAPMVRFAIDPVLQASSAGDLQAVIDVAEITNEPQRVDWQVEQQDGWYEAESTQSAWVYIDDNDDIVALSPICTHLGCTVSWEGGQNENEFFCPCHNGRYDKDGVNIANTPPPRPLDVYEQRVEEGTLYLGNPHPREEEV